MAATTAQATSPLVDWIGAPRADRTMRFLQDDDSWATYSYDEVAARCRGTAERLLDAGARPGSGAVIVLPSGFEFVTALFGAFAAGLRPTPVAPPGFFQDGDEYLDHLRRVLEVAAPSAIVAAPGAREQVDRALEGLSGEARVVDVADVRDGAPLDLPEHVSLLQFTSGSSGRAHGVPLSGGRVEANVEQIARHLRYDGTEHGASWLPTYHDMGLIGCLLMPCAYQGDATYMAPDKFVRDPLKWLSVMGHDDSRITASPPFGLAYAAKRVAPDDLAGMDFSRWRVTVVGAERVGPDALQAFLDMGKPHGLKAEQFIPAYGLAEATVAVTADPLDRAPHGVMPRWEELSVGNPVPIEAEGWPEDPYDDDAGRWLVACGRPLDGTAVRILDDDGEELPEGHLGEIEIRGPGVGEGYAGASDDRLTRFGRGRLASGDAGFVIDGELYVVGRSGDALSVRGRNIYAEELENRLAEVDGVRKGKSVAFAGPDEVVAVVEAAPGAWAQEAGAVLSRYVGQAAAVTVVAAEQGTIARTTSGKPRRREMWRRHVEQRLDGEVVDRREPRGSSGPSSPRGGSS